MPDQPASDADSHGPASDELSLRAQTYEHHRFAERSHTRRIDRWEKSLARRVFALVGSDAHILDSPCGTGRFLEFFLPARELTLLDRSPQMLEVCKQRVLDKPNTKTILADITAIPLPDASADLVWCMRLFHHLGDNVIRSAILKELSRVSRKYVAMTFYNSRSLRYMRRKLMGRSFRGQYTTYKNIVALAAEVGLEVVERKPSVNIVQSQCFVLFRKK